MKDDKLLMAEAAVLYYEKGMTQQEISRVLNSSRQTVSKLLGEAVREGIVEITVHNPRHDRATAEQQLAQRFGIPSVKICPVSSEDAALCRLMTAKAAVEYLLPFWEKGGQNIAVSWGRTVQAVIEETPFTITDANTVFPLFGATDRGQAYFASNELARVFADKIHADTHFAWFPYQPDSEDDCLLFRRTGYYRQMQERWNAIDIALVGIGNREALNVLGDSFGSKPNAEDGVGDIATHTFRIDGTLTEHKPYTLCISVDALKKAKQVVGVACGADKTEAIIGALRTGLLSTLITDEYTASRILKYTT